MGAWHGLSLWGPGDSPGHPKLPNSRGGDEWTSKALGIKKGLAMMCTKTSNCLWLPPNFDSSTRTLSNPIFYKFCNHTSNIHNTYHLSNFPNYNQYSPNYYLFPSNIIGSYHITMKHQGMMNLIGCILKPLYLTDPSS